MERIFKKCDRVYCLIYGWGTICDLFDEVHPYPIDVMFDRRSRCSYTDDGRLFEFSLKTLSFTEYTLEGFSQERPEPLPKPGDIVWGKGFHTTDWSIGHYLGKQHASYKISSTPNALSYWLADKITTKNPYANEQ